MFLYLNIDPRWNHLQNPQKYAWVSQPLDIRKHNVKIAECKRTHDDNSAGREEFQGGAWILLCLEVEARRQLRLIAKI